MSKAIILFFIVVFAVYVVELKSLSDADVDCSTQPGGCDPKEMNPRPKRHLHCLLFPRLCMPQYVPVPYPSAGCSVQGGDITNPVNRYGDDYPVVPPRRRWRY